jgi:hypothetical protein
VNKARYGEPASDLKQSDSSNDVGLNCRNGFVDAPVDVRFGGAMVYGVATTHARFCRGGVADIAFNELIGRMICNRMEIREIASVRELVVVYDLMVFFGLENMTDEI